MLATIEEIKTAINSLSETEFARLRKWFLEKDWEKWDRAIEKDSASGKLDFLIEESLVVKERRIPGLNRGEIWISDDFDAPLPDKFWLGEET